MQRRIWIKQITIVGGGLFFLPACKNDDGSSSVPLKNISVSSKEENLLAEITETIIPATDTPGAKEMNLHQFALKMIDDCYDKEDQRKILAGLRSFDRYSKDISGKSFHELSVDKRLHILRQAAADKSKTNIQYFIDQLRKWTIRGYETSEYVLTKITPYHLVPGRFAGCKKITKLV